MADAASDFFVSVIWHRQGHVYRAWLLLTMVFISGLFSFSFRYFVGDEVSNCWTLMRNGMLCLLGLGTAMQAPLVVQGHINGLSDELDKEKMMLMLFKLIETSVEAAPWLLLTSNTVAVSLFTEHDAPDVVPLTWVSLVISAGTLIHTVISTHAAEKKVSSQKKMIFELVLGMFDMFSCAVIPPLLFVYTDLKILFLLLGTASIPIIIDRRKWLPFSFVGVLDAIMLTLFTLVSVQVYNSRCFRTFRYLTSSTIVWTIIITSKANFPNRQAASLVWISAVTCALAFGGEYLSTIFSLRFWDTLEGPCKTFLVL